MTALLWTGDELLKSAGGILIGELPSGVTGISIDSRTIAPGELFVALAGPHHDGHDHVAGAFERGASCALVHRPCSGGPQILIDDTLRGLERLARAARDRAAARIIAVTGSVGKTSTKEMLALALGDQGLTHASIGSFNNHWGVPLSLARLPREAAFAVFEIGMNHAGEIAPLSRLVRPDVAIVTTVEAAHLEFFSGIEAIADAKAEIFEGLSPTGTAIINRDNDQFARLAEAASRRQIGTILGFGTNPEASIRLVGLTGDATGSEIEITLQGRRIAYRLGQPGRHLAMNSVAALAACAAVGADVVQAAASLARFEGIAGRGKRRTIEVPGGTASLIDESYNASPASVRAALAVLGTAPIERPGRRIAVLGDMRELGQAGPDLHRALAPDVEAAGIDLLVTCGPLMRELDDAAPVACRAGWHETAAAVLPHLATMLRPGDIVMVKGSLGSRMADIVKPLLAGAASAALGSSEIS